MKGKGDLRIANILGVNIFGWLRRGPGLWSNSDRFVFVIALLLIFIAAARTPLDSDLWWHLRAGETTWAEGRPLLHDPFSFTRLGQSWINHSWLSQVGIYLLFGWGGFMALAAAVATLAAGMMALVYFQQDGPALLRAFLVIFGTAVIAVVWTPRPQMLSLILFAFTTYILHIYKRRGLDCLWLLVPLFMLWSNLHGGYPLGLIAIGAMIVGEILNHIIKLESPDVLNWRQIRKLALIFMISSAAVIINPNLSGAWLIPFQTVGVDVLHNYVSEWASPDFHDVVQQPLLWLVFALIGAIGFSGRRLDGSDLAGVVVFGMMAFIARRNFGPFGLVAIPVLSRHLWPALCGVIPRLQKPIRTDVGHADRDIEYTPAWKKGLNLLLVAALGLVALGKLYIVTQPAFVAGHIQASYPAAATAWMQAHAVEGNLMNEYDWGGYLVWSLRGNPVFVDGRTDLFGDEIIGEWITVVQASEGWDLILDRWKVNLVLLKPDRPVVPHLLSSGWRELYRDDQAILLAR